MSVETARSLMRPFITVCFVGLVVFLAVTGKIEPKEILTPTGMIVAFWFGERAATKKPE
jgi:hypothetical protein